MKRALTLALALPFALMAAPARADDDAPICSLYEEVSNTQLLRRLSLDLRRRLPSYEEYEALGEADVDEAIVTEYVQSADFVAMVRRFHDELLWNSVANVALSSNEGRIRLTRIEGTQTSVYNSASAGRRQGYRGDADAICADYQQIEWCTAQDLLDGVEGCDDVGLPRKDADGLDGWVEVSPYWDPSTTVKVCAFEAQTAEYWEPGGAPVPEDPQLFDSCNFVGNTGRQGCGCGPDLRYCFGPGVEEEIRAQIREQMLQLIEDHTLGGLPYSEMLTTQRSYMNGPLDLWRKHLAYMTSLNQTFNFWFPGDAPPPETVDYLDTTWREELRGEVHAGIVTLPAFSLRFQTNRARANRFRTIFMGKYFEPPASAEQPGCIEDTDDLTQRCYCMACHQELEQLAAHFGNVAEAGSALLTDRSIFPEETSCAGGSANPLCNRFYVSDPEATGFGKLLPLQFADDSPVGRAIHDNFNAGPRALAEEVIADGTFARTIVLQLWRYLMRRDMDLSPLSPDNEVELLDTLAGELQEHDDFAALVTRMVQLEQYRRAR